MGGGILPNDGGFNGFVGIGETMMTIGRLGLSLLSALALCACVAKVGQVNPAPRVTNAKQAAHVTVYRDESLVGAVSTMSFFIDGKEVYGLRRGERYSFELDPGWHGLSYRIGLNECGEKFQFAARGQYSFRLLPTCGIKQTGP
jgi:hypothetical protein